MVLYKYIYVSIYKFYVKVFREKEIPHYFAGALMGLVFSSVYQLFNDFLFIYTRNEVFALFGSYTKYLSLGIGILGVIYVSKKNRHKKIYDEITQLDKKVKFRLKIISIIYILATLVGYYYCGTTIREINGFD